MKRFLILLAFCLTLTACPATTTAPPTAPGYANQTDQQMGEILAAARAFYTTVQQDSANGSMTLTPAVKQAFNTFGTSLNAAESVYLAYHAQPTAANQAAAQTAVNNIQTQQAALPLPTVTK